MKSGFCRVADLFPVSDNQELDHRSALTFDIDWAHDEILSDTIELVGKYGVPATWFVTHDTPLLTMLRKSKDFEVGLHPNFNFLLNGDNSAGNSAKHVMEFLIEVVPEAKSVRSHSMTQSSHLLDVFGDLGLTHDVNQFVPYRHGSPLRPWLSWNGICRVPYCWEDDVHVLYSARGVRQLSPKQIASRSGGGLKVFDFHPIHVFLNTENLYRYERTRHLHRNPKELLGHRYEGYGTRSRLIELLEEASRE